MRTRLFLFALGALSCSGLSGCGPVQASTTIADGTEYLAQAEREGAERYARYEYWKSRALLEQAKVKNGYGEYEIARRYAEQAVQLATEARKASIRRRDLEIRRLQGIRPSGNRPPAKKKGGEYPPPAKPEAGPEPPAPPAEKSAPEKTAPPPSAQPPASQPRPMLPHEMQPAPQRGPGGQEQPGRAGGGG